MYSRMAKGVARVRLRNRSVSPRVRCARGWSALWSVVSYLQLGTGPHDQRRKYILVFTNPGIGGLG